MKPFRYSLFLIAVICLAGCGGSPKDELNSRMQEMISFIDVVKDKEGFMGTYFDPRAVQRAKESNEWSAMMAAVTDEVIAGYRAQLVLAQKKVPVMSYKGEVATYTLDAYGLPELNLVKLKGQWYLYHVKKK